MDEEILDRIEYVRKYHSGSGALNSRTDDIVDYKIVKAIEYIMGETNEKYIA